MSTVWFTSDGREIHVGWDAWGQLVPETQIAHLVEGIR